MSDQFGDAWDDYFKALETRTPLVEAIGITDYCLPESYKAFKARRGTRVPNVKLAFPNVEFRLSVETEKRKGVNIHLLFSPDSPDHVERIERALAHLVFNYNGTHYRCTKPDLILLGRAFDPSQSSDLVALGRGAGQFKVSFDNFRSMLIADSWAAANSIVAIANSEKDGTSGLSKDSGFAAIQQELRRYAHVVFSGSAADRAFWLGAKDGFSRDQIEKTYGSLKPCLHGSDAHNVTRVLEPDGGRLCWIRAEPTFSGLRQTLLEPEARVWLGKEPPSGPSPSHCIRSLKVSGAAWLQTAEVTLNDGLVAIIGPKGSGKTALADMIAHAGRAAIEDSSAFLRKAQDFTGQSKVELTWQDDTVSPARPLSDLTTPDDGELPEVRYLSQQFVERLCSADGLGDELLAEIEAVVFASVPSDSRMGATNFKELRALRLEFAGRSRAISQAEIERLSDQIATEEANRARIKEEERHCEKLMSDLEKAKKELAALLPKAKSTEASELARVKDQLDARNRERQLVALRLMKVEELEKDLTRIRAEAVARHESLKEAYKLLGLASTDWRVLQPNHPAAPEVNAVLDPMRNGRTARKVTHPPLGK